MNEINQQPKDVRTEYLIYLDILGFEELAQQIAESSKIVSERKIREDFIQVINQKIYEAEQRGDIVGKSFSQRDDWLLVVNSLDLVFKIIYEIMQHTTDYRGYEKIPLEIAVGYGEYDKWAKLSESKIACENPTITFLKTPLIGQYHKLYKTKYLRPVTSSFIVFTESAYNKMGYFEKELCEKIDTPVNEKEIISFFVANIEKVIERGNVFRFLQKIGKTASSSYRRIDCAFVPPNEYETILDTLERQKVIFLIGDPEIGKTFTAARILWEYYLKGYNPVWNPGTESPQKVLARQKLSEFNIDNHSVTYFEDPFGAGGRYEDNQVAKTIRSTIYRVQSLDARVIISSREELFKQFQARINSERSYSDFIIPLRLMKPSYTDEKMVQILLNWANQFDCFWLNDEKLIQNILFEARKRLRTPFSLWDFASSSIGSIELAQINALLKEKSKDIKLSFAEEITHMPKEKILFLSLVAILSSIKGQILKSTYCRISEHYPLKGSFEKTAKEFEVKVSFDKAEQANEGFYHFTHPSYEEAVINSWNDEEVKDFIMQIFSFLINQGDPFVKGCCGLSLMKYFYEFSFKEEAKALLLTLLNDKKAEARLGIVLGLEHSFRNFPIEMGLEFVKLIMKDKNSDIRDRALCIVSNNYHIIPIKESNEILSTALEDHADKVRYDAFLCIRTKENSLPAVLVKKAEIVHENLSKRGDWATKYFPELIGDDLFKPYEEVRYRIEQVKNREIRMYLKAIYLLAAEGCELTGKLDSGASCYHRIKKIVYGPKGTDVSVSVIDSSLFVMQDTFKNENNVDRQIQGLATKKPIDYPLKLPIALFKIKSARKYIADGETIPTRIVALPMFEQYDPWVKDLYDYFMERGNDYVFPFNRQKVWEYITRKQRIFEGLTYRIRSYNYIDNREPQMLKISYEHPRKVKLLGLRRLRTYELIDKYNFISADVEVYTSRNDMNVKHNKNNPIVNQDWHRYIHKLCIRKNC